ncbi:unnamed protein product [Caenorhabditis angaria]|uniref:MATH domain-containing protein n=1 Tax=Caenorhabditis angaria TaxID=860376 RepID=A0A9P1N321_9PELO|nr:unnamed protein product [Caenorhabditis angaria]
MHPIVSNGNKLKWKFENIKNLGQDKISSEKFTIGPVDWVIDIGLTYDGKNLAIFLRYDKMNKNEHDWICDARGKLKLLKQNGAGKHESEDFEVRFLQYRDSLESENLEFSKVLDSSNGFIKEDSIIVEIDLSFKYYDFSKQVENFTDIIINIYETNFYLNKGVLSSKSEYFYNLFVIEKSTETCIKLDDISPDELICMVVPYPSPDPIFDDECYSFINVAQKYGVASLHETCEKYLISVKYKDIMVGIKIAEQNGYEKLMEHCIEQFKSPIEIKNLHADVRFEKLNDVTKWKIMHCLLEMF